MFDKIRSMIKSKEKPATEVAEKKLKNVDPHRMAIYDDYIIGTDAFKDRWVTGEAKETPNKTLAYKDRIYHYYAPQKAWGIFEEKTLIFDLNTGMYIGAMTSDYVAAIRRENSEEEKAKRRVNDLLHAGAPADSRTKNVNQPLRSDGEWVALKVDAGTGFPVITNGDSNIISAVPFTVTGVTTSHEIPYHEAKKKVMNHENWREVGEYLGKYPLSFDTNQVEIIVCAPNMTSIVQLKLKPLKTTPDQDITVTLDLVIENDVANMTRLPVWLISAEKTNSDDVSDLLNKTLTSPQKFNIERPAVVVERVMTLLGLPKESQPANQSFGLEWKEVATSEYIPVDEPLLVYYGAEESAGLPAYMTEAVLCGITGEWKSQTQETLRKITHWAMQPVGPHGLQINKKQQLL